MLGELLRVQAGRYPLMQAGDAVKLLYQHEFGSGHLVKDEKGSLRFLCQEYAALEKSARSEPYEDIGNGYVRLNLAALDIAAHSLEDVNRMFIATAEAGTGSMANFLAHLELLRTLTKEGIFSFSPTELENYLAAYSAKGYPAVSHSVEYRQAYLPAYRVVLHSLLKNS